MDDELKKLFEEQDRLERERLLVTSELLTVANQRLAAETRFNDILALLLEIQLDSQEEQAETLHRIETYLAVIAGAMAGPGEVQSLLEGDLHRREYLTRVIGHQKRNLERLQERVAIYGPHETPISILNQIEITENEIEKYQIELEQLTDD